MTRYKHLKYYKRHTRRHNIVIDPIPRFVRSDNRPTHRTCTFLIKPLANTMLTENMTAVQRYRIIVALITN